jgi:hypothetical protein
MRLTLAAQGCLPRHAGHRARRKARGADGRDARPSRANVRHPAAVQLPTAYPFVLDGLPGTTPCRPRSVAGRGRAFGTCCFAGKLRSPCRSGPGAIVAEALDPYADPYADLYAGPYAGHPRTPPRPSDAVRPGHAPRRGSGAAAPQGALRAIDPRGAAAILADLRSAPPTAAFSSRPWLPRRVVRYEYHPCRLTLPAACSTAGTAPFREPKSSRAGRFNRGPTALCHIPTSDRYV